MKALVAERMLITRLLNLSLGKTNGQGCGIKEIPKPSIEDHEILAKVTAVALNPTDFKHIDFLSPPHSIIGCDFAGEVVEVGKAALGGWQLGDRVAGMVHGGIYPDRGAFAEYVKMDADLAWKVPSTVTDVAAATYGVSAVTAMMVLHKRLDVEESSENAAPILIYAGSTCAGFFAIQLAKKAGRTVITTASPHSFDLVKSYGADHVFDYRSKSSAADIIKAFPDISLAMDCFSEGNSTQFCAEILKQKGGKVVTLIPNKTSKITNVENDTFLLYTVFGREFSLLRPIGPKFPASASDREAFARFCAELPQLVENVKPPPIQVLDGGMESVLKGLDDLRQGRVSGKKIVVKIA